MLSGGKSITGWAVSDSGKNIWKASAPGTFATRQLYVNGKIATRARSSSISRSNMTIHQQRVDVHQQQPQLLEQPRQPERAELNIIGSWTNRYSPIQCVQSNSVTMAQPAWDENTWGYDTVQSPYRQGPIYAENDYTLLDQPGEWYQDTTAGALYYIPLSGQDLTKADVELPQLQSCSSSALPAPRARRTDLRAFSRATPTRRRPWPTPRRPAATRTSSRRTISSSPALRSRTRAGSSPNSSDGFADQQTGGFLVGPRSNYPGGARRPCSKPSRPLWTRCPPQSRCPRRRTSRSCATGSSISAGGSRDRKRRQRASDGVGLGANGVNVTGCGSRRSPAAES